MQVTNEEFFIRAVNGLPHRVDEYPGSTKVDTVRTQLAQLKRRDKSFNGKIIHRIVIESEVP